MNDELQKKIGYRFKNEELLERALSTPSLKMEDPLAKDNQRLEFLGDAVFGLLSAEVVFAAHPSEQEGELTVRRTHLVSGAVLAATAEELGLRDFVKRNSGAHELPRNAKMLADALEAVMGAVWLDGGLEAARRVFGRLPLKRGAESVGDANPKGTLQMKAQSMRPPRHPEYTMIRNTGPAHAPEVTVRVSVPGLGEAEATAGSKSAASTAAAAAMLRKISGEEH